jgi:hypothetical protein
LKTSSLPLPRDYVGLLLHQTQEYADDLKQIAKSFQSSINTFTHSRLNLLSTQTSKIVKKKSIQSDNPVQGSKSARIGPRSKLLAPLLLSIFKVKSFRFDDEIRLRKDNFLQVSEVRIMKGGVQVLSSSFDAQKDIIRSN